MSMDEQYQGMVDFRAALISFNERLKASTRDLEEHHDIISPLWQDEMRRHYDRYWDPFRQQMLHYAKVEGPGYVEFLTLKMYSTERYLRGG